MRQVHEKRGRSEYAILGMLTLGPMSGYDIHQLMQRTTAHFWSESFGQIYPALGRLSDQRLVKVHSQRRSGRDRQVCSITSRGRAHLRRWLKAPPAPQPLRNELLLKLFFGRHGPAETAAQHVQDFRENEARDLRLYETMEAEISRTYANHPDLPYWGIALHYGRILCEANVRWCDATLGALYGLSGKRNVTGQNRKRP